MLGFDNGGAETAEFYFERSMGRTRHLARDGGGVSVGDVQDPATSAWFFLSARWDGAGPVRFAWRELGSSALTMVTTARDGFTPTALLIFESVFWSPTFEGHAAGVRFWTADLTDAELLEESRQVAPRRWGNLGQWYRLRNAASAAQSYSGAAPLTVTGTLADADDPPLPISYGAA